MNISVLRDNCDPILRARWDWRVGSQISHEGIQVDHAGQEIRSSQEGRKAIAASSQEVIYRHTVRGGHVNINTVDLHVTYLAAEWG